jgi:superfamily II DNA or RNA helicase
MPPTPNRDLVRDVRTMIRRYEAHIESGNHVLREGSQQQIAHSTIEYFGEIDPATGLIHTNGYKAAPGGIGKTIDAGDFFVGINTMPNGRYVLGDPALGKRIMVTVPTNTLADQWGDALLGEMNAETGLRAPSVFEDRFTEETVGIYHADLSDEEKEEALSKAIVIIVHDSARLLHAYIDPATGEHAPRLLPEDFDVVYIDEVDERVRGDATREFYSDAVFPNCMVVGCTASHLFKSGLTIGDYLFGGKRPICEILHEDAVQKREVAPHINIIVEPEVDLSSEVTCETEGWEDYTDAQQLRFIEQTGTDDALLDAIRIGAHPRTGKRLRDMMQLHQAVNIEHGKHIARELNAEFGDGYAEAVWGGTDEEMDDDVRRIIKQMLRTGDLRAVVQCKLWGRGTNIPELELTVQHAPSLSPNKTIQFHTRGSRKHDGRKIALYLSPFIRGIDQLVIGELLGGLYMIPPGYDFPPTTERENRPSVDPPPWPEIEGVTVYYTQQHLEMFARQRRRQREIDGLEVKPRNMLTPDQLAAALSIDRDILYDRVINPLRDAYERRQARQEFIDLRDVLHVLGKIFPVRRMGFYQHNGQEVFCVDSILVPLCEHTLYGCLDHTPPEVLDKNNARQLLGCNKEQIDTLWRELQQAFFSRRNYERRTEIQGIDFSYDSFSFFRRQEEGTSEFFIFPDALIPAYRRVNGADLAAAQHWAEQPAIRQCKTSDWYTETEVMEALEINPLTGGQDAAFVAMVFDRLRRQSRQLRLGRETEVTINIDRRRQSLTCAKRWLPLAQGKQQTALAINRQAFQWIKNRLDMGSTYEAGQDFGPDPDMTP